MELSRATQYALRTLLDLAVGGPSRIAEVADRRGIPHAQAGKIVGALTRRGLMLTNRGAHGGIRLARPAHQITLRDVVEAMEGPIVVARCLRWDDCPCDQPCPVRSALARAQRSVEETFDAVRISDLAFDEGKRTDRQQAAPSSSVGRPRADSVAVSLNRRRGER